MSAIIPAPARIDEEDGSVTIDATTRIEPIGETQLAADWLKSGLSTFAGIEIGDQGTGTNITLQVGNVNDLIPLTSGVRADGENPHREGYEIAVREGEIVITGMTPEAVFRGATSLVQRVALEGGEIPAGLIADAPRLAWRGLSFDVVRCFHPVSTVQKVIDLLALYKMNVLHLHLTDTEGWRFQVDSWPLLTEVSGQTARNNRPGGFYTHEEFAEIVRYASDRYITVVPEFDSPGHTASVLAAYPGLAAEGILETDPAMHYLHPSQPRVDELLRDVYTAMAEASNGARIHVGGDEAIAMDHETFKDYIDLALPIARSTGKSIVAWQEAARGGLADGDLMQVWIPEYLIENMQRRINNPSAEDLKLAENPVMRAFAKLLAAADKDLGLGLDAGADVIVSPATQMYLDTKYMEPSVDPAQHELQERLGLPQNVYGQGTVEDSYNWDPAAILPGLTVDRIAGVEAAIWCETIEGEDDVFFQLLPRLAGVAEKAWSEHREWDDYRARLAQQPVFWDAMGLPWFKSSVVWDS